MLFLYLMEIVVRSKNIIYCEMDGFVVIGFLYYLSELNLTVSCLYQYAMAGMQYTSLLDKFIFQGM